MEILYVLLTIIFLMIAALLLTAKKWYEKGYKKGASAATEVAEKRMAEYVAGQEWVYEDSVSPRTRYNRQTGEVQRRYRKPSSLFATAIGAPAFTEWRTVKAKQVPIEGITK